MYIIANYDSCPQSKARPCRASRAALKSAIPLKIYNRTPNPADRTLRQQKNTLIIISIVACSFF